MQPSNTRLQCCLQCMRQCTQAALTGQSDFCSQSLWTAAWELPHTAVQSHCALHCSTFSAEATSHSVTAMWVRSYCSHLVIWTPLHMSNSTSILNLSLVALLSAFYSCLACWAALAVVVGQSQSLATLLLVQLTSLAAQNDTKCLPDMLLASVDTWTSY